MYHVCKSLLALHMHNPVLIQELLVLSIQLYTPGNIDRYQWTTCKEQAIADVCTMAAQYYISQLITFSCVCKFTAVSNGLQLFGCKALQPVQSNFKQALTLPRTR